MDRAAVSRVNYFSHQILRTQDFEDEQAYHLQARRRHNISHHVWGIVTGLELTQDKDKTIIVTPGFAVDGFGRELMLAGSRSVPATAFDEKQADSLDVWALYARTSGDRGDPAYQPCIPSPMRSPYRWNEGVTIEWTRAGDALVVDPALGVPEYRQPPDVSADDLSFDATRGAPDDPAVRWPVFLGRVDRRGTAESPEIVIDPGGRPYAGARAEAVVSPAEDARMQIGTAGDNEYRFAVFLEAEGQDPLPPPPRIALDRDGDWQVRGSTTVRGNVTLDAGALEFGQGVAPAVAAPWRIYRVGPDPQETDELRIEIDGTASTNKLVVGVFADGAFKPCLTVAADCTVTVHGDLIVQGKLPDQVPVVSGASQEANAVLASVFIGGLMQTLNLAATTKPPEINLVAADEKASAESGAASAPKPRGSRGKGGS
jgi:hypothetical protein